jgi:DNA-binding NarL/FixJ family response regulator
VVVAHRSRLVRDLVRTVLAGHGTEVVGETSSRSTLVEVCRKTGAAVAIADTELDDGPLAEVLPDVLSAGCRVLVLSEDDSPDTLTTVLVAGASGYLLVGDTSAERVAEAVHAVAQGDAALNPAVAAAILEQWRHLSTAPTRGDRIGTLTPRELEVLQWLADGLATKAIARQLGVAVKTVENHKARIFEKLGVRNQAHAVSVGLANGLITAPPRPEAPETS